VPADDDLMTDDPDKLQSLHQRLTGSMKLVETTRELAGLHDLDEILRSVTRGACDALDCARASLFVFDKSTDELYTRVAIDLEIEEIRTSIDSGIVGWVARRRKVANIPDPSADARWISSVDRATGFVTRNILAAPVISQHGEQLVGVLQAINKRNGAFHEFDEELLQAFASHAATALERADLLEETRRTQALEVEIGMARDIQTSFLPADMPEIPEYELAVWWQPAEAVGGDYYDLVSLPDGRLGFITADVSGHGVAASLIMASVRAMLHVLARTTSDPSQILSLVGESIAADLHFGRFITFLIVALDPVRHELMFANAGHGPAFHFQREQQEFCNLVSTSLPFGFSDEFPSSESQSLNMQVGDLLVLGTDGVIEVRDERGAIFGTDRLKALILENRRLPAPELLKRVKSAVVEFHSDKFPADDVTLMILERKLG
jgi:sigma-B regulation protein RsbU (phosphoserine phosphatase)